MTSESCTKVADLGLRRLRKHQDNIAGEITAAVTYLKEAERLLLRSHIAMEDANWAEAEAFYRDGMLKMREYAQGCEDASRECHDILMRLCDELGYDDPFSTESSSSD